MDNEKYRKRYEKVLEKSQHDEEKQSKEFHRLRQIKQAVELQTVDAEIELAKHYKRGDKVADAVAKFGGSWSFIIIFALFLLVWMATNVIGIFHFDPYPFILLNLALSSLAAFQAPVIMMSQNRQAKRDKLDNDNDAKINRRSDAKLNIVVSKQDHQKLRIDDLDAKLNILIDMQLERKE